MTQKAWVISDTHLGHSKILEFEREHRFGANIDEHDEWIVQQCNSVVKPKDTLWILGDVCFDRNKLHYLGRMNGLKRLVLGNHDQFKMEEYQKYFISIHGIVKHKGFWMSHAPLHESVLRGLKNFHGHNHSRSIMIANWEKDTFEPDKRFINCCVEMSYGVPREIEVLRNQ